LVRSLEQAGESPLLIVTGDLTRVGNPLEFDNAVQFLTDVVDLNPPLGNFVGLRSSTWFSRAIPGNHDHWPGQPIVFGGPHPRFFTLFPGGSLPFTRTIPLANGRVIRLIGVDSDADVSPYGHQRFRAVGSFQSQLAAAAPRVGPPREEEVRVLLMHHSWHRRGPLLSIDHGTRGALDAFLAAHDIRLVLTGHTHDADIRSFTPSLPGARSVLECRCGTTTQVDRVPYAWRSLLGRFPIRRWPANTLLVHRVYGEGSLIRWEVQAYVRTDLQGFVPVSPAGQGQTIV
jgi:3',5'-cyclic AMP phosphodiesterase CpdA